MPQQIDNTIPEPFVSKQVSSLSNDTMLVYFLSTLDVRVKRIESVISGDASKKSLLAEVQASLGGFDARFAPATSPTNHAAWTESYRLERLLALIEPPENLVAELKRRTAEASEEQLACAPRLTAAAEAAMPLAVDTSKSPQALLPNGEALLRSLLLDTLEELHWNAQRKFYSRPLQKSATYRIVWAGLFAFLVFLFPYLVIYFNLFRGLEPSPATWSGLPLYTALTAGLFGAFFSRLLYLQQNWDALTLSAIRDARDINSILLRGCVGTTGAVIVYFFLQSGAMQGGLFPHFEQIGFEQIVFPPLDPNKREILPIRLFYPDASLAMLVVWCFIAGFSERLVPSILQSTEGTLSKPGGTK